MGPMPPPGTDSTVVVPVNLFSYFMADAVGILVLNPAGLLAAGTVNLPPNPTDGWVVEISSTRTITVLTVAASQPITGGGALTIGAVAGLSWRYVASINTWVRRF